MHPSYFLILEPHEGVPQADLTLSEEASEWLFHIQFWDEINKKHQTDFSQYEEEILQSGIVKDVLSWLLGRKALLADKEDEIINFRYGWNQKKEELICSESARNISEELGKLIAIFELAARTGRDIYCQL